MNPIIQICLLIGIIVIVIGIIVTGIIILALAIRYLIWYFSEDRKNIDKQIKDGDRMSDDVRNW